MIGVIEYDMGNIQSVVNALEFLGAQVCVIKEPMQLENVDKIILPGVGAFGVGMQNLIRRKFVGKLNEEVIVKKKPFLGICLGMQLICTESFEFGHHFGLGWIAAKVKRFEPQENLRIPHVGWNNLIIKRKNHLFDITEGETDVYFVHSYYVDPSEADVTAAVCDYGHEFTALVEKENVFATQFHPEKSQHVGLKILKNFIGVRL